MPSFIPEKLLVKIRNPLFELKERPDVCEEMLKDIIFTYQPIKDLDIHAYKNNDYLSNFRELTREEENSLDVRIAHNLMALW